MLNICTDALVKDRTTILTRLNKKYSLKFDVENLQIFQDEPEAAGLWYMNDKIVVIYFNSFDKHLIESNIGNNKFMVCELLVDIIASKLFVLSAKDKFKLPYDVKTYSPNVWTNLLNSYIVYCEQLSLSYQSLKISGEVYIKKSSELEEANTKLKELKDLQEKSQSLFEQYKTIVNKSNKLSENDVLIKLDTLTDFLQNYFDKNIEKYFAHTKSDNEQTQQSNAPIAISVETINDFSSDKLSINTELFENTLTRFMDNLTFPDNFEIESLKCIVNGAETAVYCDVILDGNLWTREFNFEHNSVINANCVDWCNLIKANVLSGIFEFIDQYKTKHSINLTLEILYNLDRKIMEKLHFVLKEHLANLAFFNGYKLVSTKCEIYPTQVSVDCKFSNGQAWHIDLPCDKLNCLDDVDKWCIEFIQRIQYWSNQWIEGERQLFISNMAKGFNAMDDDCCDEDETDGEDYEICHGNFKENENDNIQCTSADDPKRLNFIQISNRSDEVVDKDFDYSLQVLFNKQIDTFNHKNSYKIDEAECLVVEDLTKVNFKIGSLQGSYELPYGKKSVDLDELVKVILQPLFDFVKILK